MSRMLLLAGLVTVVTLGAARAADDGFVPLFNGKDLTGWRPAGYVVENGMLVCPSKGGGILLTEEEYDNFVLKLEFKVEAGGNNGVALRTPATGNPAFVGMEIQILDDAHPKYAKLQPYQYCGSVYGVFAAKRGSTKPAGEWNSYEITCDGSKIKIVLNGETIVDGDLSTVTDEKTVKEHPGIKRTGGHLGLMGHGDRVEFRNIAVKRLPAN